MADIAHAAQHNVNSDKTTERADEDRGYEAVAKKFVFKGNEQRHGRSNVQKVQAVQTVLRRFERLERLERFEQLFI
jgi:hypothetical protein